MTLRDKEILNYLKKNHRGRHNAVHSKDLETLFHICGRSLRRTVGRIRRNRHPVCSNVDGYFYGINREEVNETVCRLDELVMNISGARAGLLRSSVRRKRG